MSTNALQTRLALLILQTKFMNYTLVDGNNLAFRSFYGVKPLTNASMPVNAIYGFINTLLATQPQGSKLIVCFDCSRSQRRLELLPAYKANRTPAPDDFKVQLPVIKQLIPLMGGVCWEKQGVEADDLMGSFCVWASTHMHCAEILSADKDLMQCVGDSIIQKIPTQTGWQSLDKDGVFKKMGVRPDQVVDFLALVGDSADNYPGVPGVGPKTAAKWLADYQSLDGIFQHIAFITPQRFRSLLLEHKELLRLNQRLAKLDCSLHYVEEILPELEQAALQTNQLVEALEHLNLKKLAQRFKANVTQQIELF